jgi:SH3-like domain-containing protein
MAGFTSAKQPIELQRGDVSAAPNADVKATITFKVTREGNSAYSAWCKLQNKSGTTWLIPKDEAVTPLITSKHYGHK